ncbi:MAG: 16S rRNA (adenine(1518)-N(6)/adenine(1519)-N(6))-dimethyltransferase RsmA [Candidatus Sumerlaeia bacterium]|nr:16S rRNA (adenine(1518)-N(6)/adenine(1519)-N(6))-dimethyltransferase RsmA [Candidatus Sumerlaeia bacterium]
MSNREAPGGDAPARLFPPMRELLDRLGIRPDKRRAQHFLHRQETCRRIAELALPDPGALCVEVGAGLGNLTVQLADRAARVVAVEPDTEFIEWHRQLVRLSPRIEFLHADFLQLDLEELTAAARAAGTPLVAAGNLPYQITSAILFKLVDAPFRFDRIVVMMQLEVAQRIACGPAHRESGALSYKIALSYKPSIEMRIEPGEFIPPPAVRSAVLVLEPLPAPLFRDAAHRDRLYRVVEGVFRYRRKTLSNGLLEAHLAPDRAAGEDALRRAGIDAKRRPETLSLDELIALEGALAR